VFEIGLNLGSRILARENPPIGVTADGSFWVRARWFVLLRATVSHVRPRSFGGDLNLTER
jgi:hypothetical protein